MGFTLHETKHARSAVCGKTARQSDAFDVKVASSREIDITRVIYAPRWLVFEALSKREHLGRWWGSRNCELITCEMDFRPGGKWLFVQRRPNGMDYAFRGEIREIVPNERIVQTCELEGTPGLVLVQTTTLTERDGRTTWRFTARLDAASLVGARLQAARVTGARPARRRMRSGFTDGPFAETKELIGYSPPNATRR